MIEEVLKALTEAVQENTKELARQSALVKAIIPTEKNATLNVQGIGEDVSKAVTDAITEEPKEPKNENAKIDEDQKAALRKEGIRIKKVGKISDFKKMLTDYQYEKISNITVKDYDEILEIAKSIK